MDAKMEIKQFIEYAEEHILSNKISDDIATFTGVLISISPELDKFLGIITPTLTGIFAIVLSVNENGDGGN